MKRVIGGTLTAACLTAGGAALANQGTWANSSAFDGQSMSLANAVAAIEQKTGGRVMEIRFQNTAGSGVYYAVVDVNGNLLHGSVDARTDRIRTSDTMTPDWMQGWTARRDARSLEHATVPLVQAIRTAEQADDGPAIDAGLAKPLTPGNDVLAYNIEVVRDGHPQRVAIDANTNEVIRDPSMLDTWSPE